MDFGIGLLPFATFGLVMVLAYVSKRATEKKLEETRARRISAEASRG